MNRKYIIVLILSLLSFSCSTMTDVRESNAEAKGLRLKAIEYWQKGQNDLAVSKALESIKKARELAGVSVHLIEGYDDAGLYYYEMGDFENSTRFQAVAVLLSLSSNENNSMNSVYLQRLSWAFGQYDPLFDFSLIQDNPIILFSENILNLKFNPDIKKAYFVN